MENLDITPAFIDIFRRLNKHLDVIPFQKLLNDQNSNINDLQKNELKTKINDSIKKIRQLNLVLDELKDQVLIQIEQVQTDYEEKNRDLDELEKHFNYVNINKNSQIIKETTFEVNDKHLNDFNDYDQIENSNSLVDKKENLDFQIPKRSIKKPFTHHQIKTTSSVNKKLEISDKIELNEKNIPVTNNLYKKEKFKNYDSSYFNYPQINYISLSEFNYIPKYMKGRLNFDSCIKYVDEFNKTLEKKYKFMMTPSQKLTNEDKIRYALYKNQEDEETKGQFFCTPKDLHEFSDLKLSSNNTKIVIQCLRHCKRIREVRGKDKLIRYIVIN